MNSLILQTVFLNTKTLIENAIYKYENHPSVIAIKNHIKATNSSFSFQTVTKESTAKLIRNLDKKKLLNLWLSQQS